MGQFLCHSLKVIARGDHLPIVSTPCVPQSSSRRTNMVETGTLRFKKWQSMLKNGEERMRYLYTSSKLSDLDIFFPGDEEPLKVHSLILSTNSPVFFTMLNGPMAPDKLTLPEDPRHSFQKLLDHMYLDRMDLKSVEEALEVYKLAHKYEIESTKKECVKYIASNVKAETMPAVLETSVLYEVTALKKKCKEILDRDPDAIMLPETVSRLSKATMKALLTDETLAFSSEAVPFRGLIAWQDGRAEEDGHKNQTSHPTPSNNTGTHGNTDRQHLESAAVSVKHPIPTIRIHIIHRITSFPTRQKAISLSRIYTLSDLDMT
ncbi:BTB/POZ domain-containing protein 2-like isoform X8 [Oratosquilla oratoria]|uniref:BTB/POZ domain-containing protein 2-like isoform X8 n=1 Tax=Oratosquilla oratoria TaxID=337810 RepID=UPI003F766EA8